MSDKVKKSVCYSKEELIEAGYGRLLPTGSARMPIEQMLMVDRITSMENTGGEYGRGKIEAELDIKPNLWFFDCHFVDDPVMPGCLGLDAMWQLAGFFLTWMGPKGAGRALGAEQIKFFGEVTPANSLVKYILQVKRTIERGAAAIVIADGALYVDGKEIYSVKGLRVGVFNRSNDSLQGAFS